METEKKFIARTPRDAAASIFARLALESFPSTGVPGLLDLAFDWYDRLAPRDPAEEMLVSQMIWTHVRAGIMTCRAINQTSTDWFDRYSAECGKATKLFRRQMKALTDQRRPGRSFNLTSRRGRLQAPRTPSPARPTRPRHAQTAQVPPDSGRFAIAPLAQPAQPPVGQQHGPEDGVG